MTDEEYKELGKMVANKLAVLATPLDFDQLIKDGFIKKIGKSYYAATSSDKFPKNLSMKIKSIKQTKNGVKLTFFNETKAIKKWADELKQYRD